MRYVAMLALCYSMLVYSKVKSPIVAFRGQHCYVVTDIYLLLTSICYLPTRPLNDSNYGFTHTQLAHIFKASEQFADSAAVVFNSAQIPAPDTRARMSHHAFCLV